MIEVPSQLIGPTPAVRVLLTPLLVLLTAVAAAAAVPGTPESVAVYSIDHQKLEVRWSSSDYAATTGFKVQWKSGNEDYDASRQELAEPATSVVTASSSETTKRYKHLITGLTNGAEYTVRVLAHNTNGDVTASAEAMATARGTTALPNMWLNPTASDPVAAVRSEATYSVTFQGAWTTTVTSGGVPSGAHFTTLIGGVHNAGVTFLREGGMASAGVELMAELGGTSTLAAEVRAAAPNALSVLEGSGGNIGPTGSSTINPVTLTTDHPRVTLLSMVAPSPDWFVGVSGLSLLDAQGNWLSSQTVNLYPWDAGTEEGTEFSLTNSATSPQETITSLRGMGKFSNAPIATLTCTRQSVNTAPSFSSDMSFEVDENQTAVATVVAADPDGGDGVAYAVTGGADASWFEIGETTGVLTFKVPPNYERAADVASADPLNDAGNNEYIVTVTATGGTNDRAMMTDQTITVTVRNLEEAGTVSFSKVGAEIRTTLSDPDGGVSSRSWQWARSSDRSTGWTDIGGATSARYTPSSGDAEMYLRATVSYNDGHGSGKQAQGVSTNEITPPKLLVSTLVSGLSIPWDLAFTPDGTMLFTQRAGVLSSRLTNGTVRTVTANFDDLFASGETGLMGIIVDPSFSSNRRFYTCQGQTGPEIQVIAWTINAAYTVATRVADPLVGGFPAASGGRHGGCRLRFGPQGYLWIATGDAASGTVPQDLTSLGGKVLRVDASTGAGAPANPYASSPRIYTYGHRNVQGLALRPGTTQMWSVEHGPSVDDEINLLVAGRNYGWDPVPGYNEGVPMTGLVKFPDAVEAKWSSGSPTLATSGGIFLQGDQWGVWEGRLAVATLKDRKLRLFEFTEDGTFVSQVVVPELDGDFGRLRTPMMGPDGALYVSTSNGSGVDRILRVTPVEAPVVNRVAITSNPGPDETYAARDAIEVTVRFSETVTVDTTGGTPTLALTVGAQSKPARYRSGPDSAAVVFVYTVESGDIDTNGVSIAAGSIELKGGTIKGLADNLAVLAYEAVPPAPGHAVDGVRPELQSATVDGAMLVLTYDEALDEDSIPATGDFKVNVEGAERPLTQILVNESVVTLTLDSAAAPDQTVTVSYSAGTNPIRDAAGNTAEDLAEYTAKPPGPVIPPGGGGGLPPPSNPAPSAPRNLEALGGDRQVTLSWEAPEDDGGFPITDYQYLISGTGGGWISTESTDLTHTVTELTNSRVYLFQVRAVSAAGAGNSSHQVEVTPGVGRLEFAHFANGSSITSDLVLVNVFARPIRPSLYFYNREGDRIAVESVVEVTEELEVAEDGSLTVQTEMQPLEALTISTHGQGEVVAGSVTVVSNGPIGGVLRFDLPGVGVAGVGAGQPLRDALFPARRQAGAISTAAAIRNLQEEELVVTCQLMQEGAVLEEVEIELQAKGQDGRFIEEVFTATDTSNFSGLVRCRAEGEFAGVAVELDAGNGIFTTLPVLPVDRTVFRGGEYALDFAHFANGASITSDLVLVNVSIRPSRPAGPFTTPIPPTRPSFYFYDREGERIAAESVVEVTGDLELAEDGSLAVQSEMQPLQAVTISTHGQGEVVAGSVRVVAEGPIGGVLRFDLPGVGVAGVGTGQPLTDALFPARRQEGGISTAAAIRNLEEEELVVSCQLMQEGIVLEEVDIELEANGQDGRFIEEVFTRTDTSDFVGLVRCRAEGEFAGVAVELDAGNGIFTTLPVVSVQR